MARGFQCFDVLLPRSPEGTMTPSTTPAALGSPALTPEQWQALDYRPSATEIDAWAKGKPEHREADDATQYVAKIGLAYDDCILLMSRAHEYVSVPPVARKALAALALHAQPFGFRRDDVRTLRRIADKVSGADPTGDRVAAILEANELRALAQRIEMLLPPEQVGS
jgi:hypothetical protein